MLSISCQSPQVVTVEKTVVPELAFPVFPPKSEWAERNIKERTVTVPEEWYFSIAKFQNDYECLETDYKEIKELYEGKEKAD